MVIEYIRLQYSKGIDSKAVEDLLEDFQKRMMYTSVENRKRMEETIASTCGQIILTEIQERISRHQGKLWALITNLCK